MELTFSTTSITLPTDVDWYDATLYQQIQQHGFRHVDWDRLSDEWLLYIYLHDEPTLGSKRKESTLKEYFRDIRDFLLFVRDLAPSVRSLHHEEVSAYQGHLEARGYKPTTLRRKTTVIHSFLRFLHRRGIIEEDLTASMKRIAVKKESLVNRDFYEEEVQALLDYFKEHDYFMYTLLYTLVSTGLRIQELASAKWSGIYYQPDVDLHFITVFGKRDKLREVPLFEEVFQVIREFRNRRGLSLDLSKDTESALFPKPNGAHYHFKYLSNEFSKNMYQLKDTFSFIAKRIQLEEATRQEGKPIKYRITPHTCRHYTAAYYLSKGADLKAIQDLLDHDSSQTTDQYLRRTRKFSEHAAVKIGGQFMK
ncbi:hypothetical protein N781_02845 [Pontibacillus halophilus JSM 076056 = DSM 19796]|uniref:Integrase n=1 Tax=Pontibacillus halophilus JSM 076056 = DSM 19796 TaxID=1385510 RepID=A0A0A5GJB3_9BACI|nr:tyrosine-type recombinase/integrase [Pontibacillus halophilus]KGX92069.1 hypothetical protein N781_02845 [Pontibacillus halophilus JSM 076056 = DSM 19796]